MRDCDAVVCSTCVGIKSAALVVQIIVGGVSAFSDDVDDAADGDVGISVDDAEGEDDDDAGGVSAVLVVIGTGLLKREIKLCRVDIELSEADVDDDGDDDDEACTPRFDGEAVGIDADENDEFRCDDCE